MKFLKKNPKRLIVALFLVAVFMVVFCHGVYANGTNGETENNETGNTMATVLAWIFYYLAAGLGLLLDLILEVLLRAAKYNDFLNQAAVTNGWIIVRDVCNNFFIVILLVIAVGTVLRVPRYQYKELLPKLLVMAVLINFSKMFAGIMIDFAQVVMLTFANPLAQTEGRNIILAAINLPAAYSFKGLVNNMEAGINVFDVLVALIFALVVTIVVIVVSAIITVILIYRIVMLWFLVILSPAAFFLSTFPRGQQYAGQWWSLMGKYLTVGPVMIFFLYLSLFTMSNMVGNDSFSSSAIDNNKTMGTAIDNTEMATITKDGVELEKVKFSDLASTKGIFNFMIVIGLMVGSLVMGQQAGVAGGQWAGKGIAGLTKLGKGAGNFALNRAKGVGSMAVGAAKGVDYMTGGRISRGLKIAGKGGTGAYVGAALGTVIAPGIGTGLGAAIGAFTPTMKKRFVGWLNNNRRTVMDAQDGKYKAKDKGGIKYKIKEIDGKKYRIDENGKFLDSKEEDIQYHEVDGKYYRKNKDGEFLLADGQTKTDDMTKAEVKEKELAGKLNEGKEKMVLLGKDFWAGYYSSPAGKGLAVRDAAEVDKIEKLAKTYMSFNEGMLNRLLKDESNDDKKKAIAMAMAAKEAVKSPETFQKAKDLFKDNEALSKKFTDEVEKKFAHFVHDLTTVAGRTKFAKRKTEGKFDVLDAEAYKDDNVIKALQEAFTPEEFMDHMKRIGKVSAKHAARLEAGFTELIKKEEGKVVDTKGMLTPVRQAMINLTGNLAKAFNAIDVEKNAEEIKLGLKNKFKKMSAKDLTKLDVDVFNSERNREVLGAQGVEFTNIVKGATSSIGDRTMENLKKNQDASEELVDAIDNARNTNNRNMMAS